MQKVLWLIGELDLAHTHIPAGGSFGINETPGFLAMNPVPFDELRGRLDY